MNIKSFREYQSVLYIVVAAVSIIFLIISANDLIIHSSGITGAGLTLSSAGNWLYWILVVSSIGTIVFLYLYIHIISSLRKFNSLINSGSKQAFVKNLKELEQTARILGSREKQMLKEAREKWKVK